MHDSISFRGGVALKAALGAVISLIFALALIMAISPGTAWGAIAQSDTIQSATVTVTGITDPESGDIAADTGYQDYEATLDVVFTDDNTSTYIVPEENRGAATWEFAGSTPMDPDDEFFAGNYILEFTLSLGTVEKFASSPTFRVIVEGSQPSRTDAIKLSDKKLLVSLVYAVDYPTPEMFYPNGQTWTKGSSDSLIFKPDSDLHLDGGVFIDGSDVSLSDEDCDIEDGNTVVLKPSFLETLDLGEHTISYLLSTGISSAKWVGVEGSFSIKEVDKTPKMTSGDGQTWVQGSDKSLTFVSSAPLDTFIAVLVDKTPLASDKYEIASGSTKITLKPAYLSELSLGKHEIAIISDDGSAVGEFKVVAKDSEEAAEEEKADEAKSPKTGDNGMMLLGIFTASVMAAGACGIALRRREQQ